MLCDSHNALVRRHSDRAWAASARCQPHLQHIKSMTSISQTLILYDIMKYRSLDESKSEIRILNLLPEEKNSQSDSVQCTLEHMPLTAPSEYTALSYVWGLSRDPDWLFVDSSIVPITCNLMSALRSLRRLGHTRVWADAVCIK